MENKLDKYAEAFDRYLEQNVLTKTFEGDILANYLKTVLDDPGNRHLCQTDTIWRDLIKNSLMDFIGMLIQQIEELEKQKKKELEYIDQFEQGDIHLKRAMWRDTVAHITRHYSPEDLNLDGYVYLMQNTDCSKDVIFESMTKDWRAACESRIHEAENNLLKNNQKRFEEWVKQAGKTDYETINKTAQILYKYPKLNEILQMMGREKEKKHQEEDSTTTRNLPILLSHNTSHEEVDGIKTGDDLNMLLPTEIALLNDARTESVFYHKYSTKQLQSFACKPPSEKKEKTNKKNTSTPRLQEGPIIVCIDTSGSMEGYPEKIAKALLIQILEMAKKKKRKCFLITFSVRTKVLEISKPGHWKKIKDFLKKNFTGGTNGEQMLNDILKTLKSKDYSMADALIISDFDFPYPLPGTQKEILMEQAKGTRFFGLQIGDSYNEYVHLLDKIWVI